MGWLPYLKVVVAELCHMIMMKLLSSSSSSISISALTDNLLDPKKNNQEDIDWLELPDHLLSSIAFKLLYMEDFIRFGAVCRSWNSVYTENRPPFLRLRRQLPLLMVPTGFYSLIERRVYNFQLPMPMPTHKLSDEAGHCAGSSHGWLIIVRPKSYQVSLINPFLPPPENEIQLPPLTALELDDPDVHPDSVDHPRYLEHAVLSANPASYPNNYVLMAIHGQYSRLAFFRPSGNCEKVACWTPFASNLLNMADIIYYKDQFYTVDHFGSLFVCTFNDYSRRPTISRVVPALPQSLYSNHPIKWYIVESESSGDLFLILRYIRFEEEGIRFEEEGRVSRFIEDYYYTTRFAALKLDSLRSEWIKMDSLQGCILFLGENSSMSLRASDFPDFKPNTIYFTDDYQDCYFGQEKHGVGPHDMGVFDFEDGTIKQHYPVGSNYAINPAPVWVEQWRH